MAVFEKKFLIRVPSSTENLAMVRDFVNNISRQAGLEDIDAARLALAVDEACSNVIEHAYRHDRTKEVVVRVRISDDTLQVDVVDTGASFDLSQIEQKDLEELIKQRKKGGLGLRLIQEIMDEVHYDIKPGERNQLRMVKKLKKP